MRLLTLTLLVGCDPALPAAEKSPSRSASPTRSATTSPSASSAAQNVVLSTAGLGALRMGSPVPADSGLVAWVPDACLRPDDPAKAGDPYVGMWKPTVRLTGRSPLGRDEPFGMLTSDGTETGPIGLIQVWSSQYRTPSGLQVGSTNAEVRAKLPQASVLDTGQSLEYNVVSGGWRITFTVADIDNGPITDATEVQLISVYSAAEKELTFWATDGGAFCGV